ncbi:MAG: hypothetical protein IH874_04340 [Candidatus Dadabacteria bacterium]|nr:hypothetical protein [Candidatus Dadabacteria bacterium]
MRKRILITVPILLLMGCWSGGFNSSHRDSVEKSSKYYYNLLMWKHYDRGSQFVESYSKSDFEKFVMDYKDKLNITSYDIKLIEMFDKNDEALITVLITYYLYPSVTEKTVFIRDKWVRKNKSWFVVEPRYGELFLATPSQ